MKSTSFRLPYPPSVNTYWRHVQGRTYLSTAGRDYRQAAFHLTRTHFAGPVAVAIDVILPDNRRRDLDNILKALLDSIGHAGIYQDDSQVHELRVKRCHVEPPGCVDVTITELPDAD